MNIAGIVIRTHPEHLVEVEASFLARGWARSISETMRVA